MDHKTISNKKLSPKWNMAQGQGRSKKATGGIYEIFEDWLFASDTEIGPHNF
jgi:hypothetical protein